MGIDKKASVDGARSRNRTRHPPGRHPQAHRPRAGAGGADPRRIAGRRDRGDRSADTGCDPADGADVAARRGRADHAPATARRRRTSADPHHSTAVGGRAPPSRRPRAACSESSASAARKSSSRWAAAIRRCSPRKCATSSPAPPSSRPKRSPAARRAQLAAGRPCSRRMVGAAVAAAGQGQRPDGAAPARRPGQHCHDRRGPDRIDMVVAVRVEIQLLGEGHRTRALQPRPTAPPNPSGSASSPRRRRPSA